MRLVCPDCRRELKPRKDPHRSPVVVSCQCGLQLLCRLHPRRTHHIQCRALRTADDISAAWELVRAVTSETPRKTARSANAVK